MMPRDEAQARGRAAASHGVDQRGHIEVSRPKSIVERESGS
jgi:hypothetical protein